MTWDPTSIKPYLWGSWHFCLRPFAFHILLSLPHTVSWLIPGWLLGAGHQLALLFRLEFGISSFPGRIEASYL